MLRRLVPSALALALLAPGCGDDQTATQASAGESTGEDPSTSGAGATTTTGASAGTSTSGGGSGTESGTSTGGAIACGDEPGLVDRDLFVVGDSARGLTIEPCGLDRWYFVGASESTIEITIRGQASGVSGLVAYPDLAPAAAAGEPLVPVLESSQGEAAVVALEVPRSGEFALHVAPLDDEAGGTYDLELRCLSGCERETTRFPTVWVHGWTGFENIGPLEYFFGVRDHIEPLGYPLSVAVLDPYNSSEVRGGQLAEQVDEFMVEWRARKIDLIGHSQGGIDSRYVISTLGYGDRVSALLTIASPHHGTYITDLALGLAPGAAEEALSFLLNLLGAVTAQAKSDAKASFYSLSEAYMEGEFNPQNPDDPGVHYISYTGRTCAAIDFLDPKKMCNDYVDPLIVLGYDILKVARGPNDGLVTIESAMWGEFRGEMIADHIDEVGQIGGITDADFDHLAWYLDRVRELAAEGH
ncbi:MAG: hypothetical protein H6710_15145 [Myxococcales bacterium]|nr:hypothetical protein [Myxococcales bacterium]MCB9701989.1 hypothetical protein [Myxococcales bacterium]